MRLMLFDEFFYTGNLNNLKSNDVSLEYTEE